MSFLWAVSQSLNIIIDNFLSKSKLILGAVLYLRRWTPRSGKILMGFDIFSISYLIPGIWSASFADKTNRGSTEAKKLTKKGNSIKKFRPATPFLLMLQWYAVPNLKARLNDFHEFSGTVLAQIAFP